MVIGHVNYRYLSCKEMAKRSYDAVLDKELKIVPEYFEPVWYK